jgi:hypothetical protein
MRAKNSGSRNIAGTTSFVHAFNTENRRSAMGYVIDPRKNWAMSEQLLASEADPRRQIILKTLIAHSKSECVADFDALMATVSPNAHYHSYATDDVAMNEAQSPKGKDGVAAYYQGIVGSGCHRIEHDIERMSVGQDVITTEGVLNMAYPGNVLGMIGVEVADKDALYLYSSRLLIVWEFDAEGLVLCEDSYAGPGEKFDGIAERAIAPDQIYVVSAEDVA